MNPFIENEAIDSESECSGNATEQEETIDEYQLDSVVVASDEDDDVGSVSVSRMEAFYLKSLKFVDCMPVNLN